MDTPEQTPGETSGETSDETSGRTAIEEALRTRFGEAPPVARGNPVLQQLAEHRSQRRFLDRPVDDDLLRLVCAAALSAPSKSDLQQCDVVIVSDPTIRRELDALMPELPWLPSAPALIVVCGDNRRQRLLHAWHEQEFPNDHLDAFFNAATDAALVLGWMVLAAESEGLGCCPLSMIRNRAAEVGELLELGDHVFPYAGLAIGWPDGAGAITPRLPLAATIHTDTFDDTGIREVVAEYDRRRVALETRRGASPGGRPPRPWSYAKARQYSRLQRQDFGAYVRSIGFDLE